MESPKDQITKEMIESLVTKASNWELSSQDVQTIDEPININTMADLKKDLDSRDAKLLFAMHRVEKLEKEERDLIAQKRKVDSDQKAAEERKANRLKEMKRLRCHLNELDHQLEEAEAKLSEIEKLLK